MELVTMLDLSSNNGFGFTTRYVRLVDDSRSRGSQLHSGNVDTGNHISIVLESAFCASEERLGSSITLTDTSTPWACFGGVLWVNIGYGYPSFEGFVRDKILEL
jgi:hypothetical protein